MSPNVWPPLGADAPARHFSKKARNKFQRLTEEGGGEQKTQRLAALVLSLSAGAVAGRRASYPRLA